MSSRKRQQTMAKFQREQAVREKRALKRQRKEDANAAARIAKAGGYEPPPDLPEDAPTDP